MYESLRHPTKAFNLTTEPWIEVITTSGKFSKVSIRQAFEEASDIAELAFADIAAELGTYRLLLAITYRALNGPSLENPDCQDTPDVLPVDEVLEYLSEHADEFWLIHPSKPFLQADYLLSSSAKLKTPDGVGIHFYGGQMNTTSCSDYLLPGETMPFDEAARALIGANTMAKGQKYGPTPPWVVLATDSATNGIFAGKVAALPVGTTLEETLLMNLVPVEQELGIPYWEQDAEVRKHLGSSPLETMTSPSKNHYFVLSGDGESIAYVLRGTEELNKEGFNDDIHSVRIYAPAKDSDDPDRKEVKRLGARKEMWRDVRNLVMVEGENKSSTAVVSAFGRMPQQTRRVVAYASDSGGTSAATFAQRKTFLIPRNQDPTIAGFLDKLVETFSIGYVLTAKYVNAWLLAGDSGAKLGDSNLLSDQLARLAEEQVNAYLSIVSAKTYPLTDAGKAEAIADFNKILSSWSDAVLVWTQRVVATAPIAVRAKFIDGVQREVFNRLKKCQKFEETL